MKLAALEMLFCVHKIKKYDLLGFWKLRRNPMYAKPGNHRQVWRQKEKENKTYHPLGLRQQENNAYRVFVLSALCVGTFV